MSETSYRCVYLHGFLETHTVGLAVDFRNSLNARGIALELLNVKGEYGHKHYTLSTALKELDKFYFQDENKPLRLIGRSMGGFISSLYASKHPERVNRLALLNPAFDLETNWPEIINAVFGNEHREQVMADWRGNKQYIFPTRDEGVDTIIMYDYMVDSLSYESFPQIHVPTRLFAGRFDLVIPVKTQHQWKANQSEEADAKLIEYDDDHDLAIESVHRNVVDTIIEFFN